MPPVPPPVAAQPAPPKAYAAPAEALSRAQLGMPLEAWRASTTGASASCAPIAGGQDCTLPAAPLGGAYRARHLSYRFRDGRLARIAYDASIDALPYATAALKAQFGPPRATRHDTVRAADGAQLDHLGYSWTAEGASAELSDPTRSADRLTVVMRLGAAADAKSS